MDLKELRKSRGVTQAALALSMGTTQGQISRIEKGENFRMSTIVRYIKALGGRLEVMVTFPGGEMYAINLGDDEESRDEAASLQ